MHPKRMEADLGFRDLGFASGVRFFGMWDWDFAKAAKPEEVCLDRNLASAPE